MGCVQGKGIPYTPPRQRIEKLKLENGYVKVENTSRPLALKQPAAEKDPSKGLGDCGAGGERKICREGESNGACGNVSKRILMMEKIGADDLIDGWPKWLIDNVPIDVLAGLVPKTADSYDKLAKIGQGTYSNVYKARDRDTGKVVALKKVRFDTSEPESVKFMAREIIIVRKLDHPNIIKLEGIATSRMQYSLYLVFDYMQTDLSRIISRPGGKLTEPQVKCYMQQLLSGLHHCHERGILHRDIKGSNLLVDKNGMLKIADFGLSNFFQPRPKGPLTSRVVTLWYRAPELLLGSTDYGVGIDLWSAGCLLAEMFVGRPILPGRTEVEQLHRIFKLCGSPSEEYCKRMKPSTMFGQPEQYKPSFRETFSEILPSSSFSLLTTLLALEPAFRGTASLALEDGFFSSSPLACDLSGLPVMHQGGDVLMPTSDQKKKSIFKTKEKDEKKHGDYERKVSFPEQSKEESGSYNEESNAESSLQSQDMGTSASSTSSSRKLLSLSAVTDTERSLPPSPFSAFHLNRNRAAKTQAHPNAMKNIKNFPLLLASIADTGNPIMIEDNRLTLNRRSRSTVDFRTIDLENISKLFGLPDK